MRKPVLWTGVIGGAFVGACSRVMGLAFGKTIAFTYAVIVSVIANVVFDFVREPPHSQMPQPVTPAVAITDGAGAAGASLPAPAMTTRAAVAAPQSSVRPAAPPPAGNSRPGPGSGGLY